MFEEYESGGGRYARKDRSWTISFYSLYS
jgi:hypothetical protein